jgi:hypothetical protein
MKSTKRIVGATVAAAVVVTTIGAGAQTPRFRETLSVRGTAAPVNGEHIITFSAPLALPGISLGAGTYIFRRPATNVLQVLSASHRPYAMVMTVPAQRASTNGYEIVLGEPLAPGSPKRIEAWFVPGDSTGQELIYGDR